MSSAEASVEPPATAAVTAAAAAGVERGNAAEGAAREASSVAAAARVSRGMGVLATGAAAGTAAAAAWLALPSDVNVAAARATALAMPRSAVSGKLRCRDGQGSGRELFLLPMVGEGSDHMERAGPPLRHGGGDAERSGHDDGAACSSSSSSSITARCVGTRTRCNMSKSSSALPMRLMEPERPRDSVRRSSVLSMALQSIRDSSSILRHDRSPGGSCCPVDADCTSQELQGLRRTRACTSHSEDVLESENLRTRVPSPHASCPPEGGRGNRSTSMVGI